MFGFFAGILDIPASVGTGNCQTRLDFGTGPELLHPRAAFRLRAADLYSIVAAFGTGVFRARAVPYRRHGDGGHHSDACRSGDCARLRSADLTGCSARPGSRSRAKAPSPDRRDDKAGTGSVVIDADLFSGSSCPFVHGPQRRDDFLVVLTLKNQHDITLWIVPLDSSKVAFGSRIAVAYKGYVGNGNSDSFIPLHKYDLVGADKDTHRFVSQGNPPTVAPGTKCRNRSLSENCPGKQA